jgi:hypothetical protein
LRDVLRVAANSPTKKQGATAAGTAKQQSPAAPSLDLFVLSTQTADEMDILHLADVLMGVDAANIVGSASAPGDAPTELDRAWFFKLFSLRGVTRGVERMCFFTFMQKANDDGW